MYLFLFCLGQESPPSVGSIIVVKACKLGEFNGGRTVGTSTGEKRHSKV